MRRPERRSERDNINILSGVLDALKDLFGLEKTVVAVELNEGYIKIAETAVFKGRKELVRLSKRPLTAFADSAISEEIDGIFDSLGISHRKIRLSVPRHLVTVRFLRLPSSDDGEIKKIIKLEALKYVPYTDEAVIAGYRVVERFEDGYSSVLLAIAQSETVHRLVGILKKARLDVEDIALGSEGLLMWCALTSAAAPEEAALAVNVDPAYIDIGVIAGGKLIFTRGVSYDVKNPISKEKIVDQVKMSMMTYRKGTHDPVKKLILCGAQAAPEECKALLETQLNIPVEIADPMKDVPVNSSAQIEPEGASFVELLGLVFKAEDMSISLMPEALSDERRTLLVKKNIIFGAALILTIVSVAVGIAAKKLGDKTGYLKKIDSELSSAGPKVRNAKKMLKDINIVKEGLKKKPLAIDILREVHKITPDNISFTMLDYERGRSLTVRGSASALGDVFAYVSILEKSPYFENVKVKYATKRITAGKEVADFEATCALTPIK
ncbi:MAG: pilus assembly protein PilM [Candidatus Omnitrophota bacterium]